MKSIRANLGFDDAPRAQRGEADRPPAGALSEAKDQRRRSFSKKDALEELIDAAADVYRAFGAPWMKHDLTRDQHEALHRLYAALPGAVAARGDMEKKPGGAALAARLADCLAHAVDTPLFSFFELGGEVRQCVYLGSFLPTLAADACELLEEAGK